MDQQSDDCDDNQDKIKSKLKTTTLSTVYNIVLQIGLRLFSFVVNAFILRFITKETLGIINVRLLLLYTTIQFITREPTRRTCAASDNEDDLTNDKKNWLRIVNITQLTIPLSFLIGLIFSIIWYYFLEKPNEVLEQYQWAIISIYFSVIIESFSETCFIFGQRNDYIRLKVFIECLFQITRSSLLAIFIFFSPEHSVIGFAIAQLVASLNYTLAYYIYFIFFKKISAQTISPTYFQRKNKPNEKLDPLLIKTWLTFLKNSVIKQFLTEGERYIMTMFSVINFAEQGVYDVINNLGSLPARLIFQQIEENGYLLFSSLIKRDLDSSQQKPKLLKSLLICTNLVKLMSLIGMMLFVYGFNAAPFLLFIYGGRNFISEQTGILAVNLFKWHCIYIIFIALNGILESYSFAAMNSEQLDKFNRKMLITSIVFTFSSLLITSILGSIGFIIANCLNMLTRIIISLLFIGKILPEYSMLNFLKQSQPNILSLISFVLIFFILNIIQMSIYSMVEHSIDGILTWSKTFTFVTINGVLVLIHLFCLYKFESGLIDFVKNEIFSLKKKIKTKNN